MFLLVQDDNEYEDIPDESGPEEGIYGGTPGDLGNDIYDNPQVVGGVKSPTMKYSGEGIYDNPESMTNEDPIYDNEAGTVVQPENRLRRPRRMAEFDQSIYSKVPGMKNEGSLNCLLVTLQDMFEHVLWYAINRVLRSEWTKRKMATHPPTLVPWQDGTHRS